MSSRSFFKVPKHPLATVAIMDNKVTVLFLLTGLLVVMAFNDFQRFSAKTIRRRSILGPWPSWRNHHSPHHAYLNNNQPINSYSSNMYADICSSKDGLVNLCRSVHNCSFVIETSVRVQMTVCAWSGFVQLVCCALRSPEEASSIINALFHWQHQQTSNNLIMQNYQLPHQQIYSRPLPVTLNSQYHNQQTLNLVSAIAANVNRFSSEKTEEPTTQTSPNPTTDTQPPVRTSPKPEVISIKSENGSLIYSIKESNKKPISFATEKPKPRCGLPSYNYVENRRSKRNPVLTRLNSKYPTNVFHATSMIVGGNAAAFGLFPWMAAIYKSVRMAGNYRRNFLCAGSIIDRWHVITAAHCFDKRDDLSVFTIRIGDQDIPMSPMMDIGNQLGDIRIEKLMFHPEYNPPQVYNDLAIIRLSKPVPLDMGQYLPICLPPNSPANDSIFGNLTGTEAIVTGWGATGTGRPATSILQQVALPILPNIRCDEVYRHVLGMSVYFPKGITDDMLCAGYETGGKDACQGDSGGPLMLADDENRWTLVGIVSVGRGCAEPGFPGLYTRISQFISWIKNTTQAT